MIAADTGWQAEFEAWLAPSLARLRRQERRRWPPRSTSRASRARARARASKVLGLDPRMAARVAPGEVQQPPHFVAASPWATAPLEAEPVRQADPRV